MNTANSMRFYELPRMESAVAPELLAGLRHQGKTISPKFFYDERGSELFTEITRQPEYYPTRTETGLLAEIRGELRSLIGENAALIEYGSGSSEKIRLLLEGLRPRIYVPLDISRDYLEKAASAIAVDHPWLEVRAACVDYTSDVTLPFELTGRRVGFFPGSSIGNFSRPDAARFLTRVRAQVQDDGALLIGVDLKKDRAVLDRAYNDAAGVTAEFNLNVLNHLNRLVDADFDVGKFRHHAAYNEEDGCVQMFLESTVDQVVHVAGEQIRFEAGERIHTENSHKYSQQEFEQMASDAGFTSSQCWQDDKGWFAIFYLSSYPPG